jgi:hypothetical protein
MNRFYVIFSIMVLFTNFSCKKKNQNDDFVENQLPETEKKPVKDIKNPKVQLASIIPKFPLKERFISILKCKQDLPCKIEKDIIRDLKVFSKDDINLSQKKLIEIYKTGDIKLRVAAIHMLRFLNPPDSWIDLIDEWLRSEKSNKVRYQLYLLCSQNTHKRAETILFRGVTSETNFTAFKGAVNSAFKKDLKNPIILPKALSLLKGHKAKVVLLKLSILPKSKTIQNSLIKCRDSHIELSGRCALSLSSFGRKVDFEEIFKLIKKGKSTDVFNIATISSYSENEWFPKKQVIKLLFKIAKNREMPSLFRESALGEIAKLADGSILPVFLEMLKDKSISKAVLRAQWRVRKKIGFPNLKPLAKSGKTSFSSK